MGRDSQVSVATDSALRPGDWTAAAPIPPDEHARLAALRRLAILDSPPEKVFDRIVALVARLLNVPIAAISLIDTHREWLKAAVGPARLELPREHAFCARTICGDSAFVVPDAALDARFRSNPQVTDDAIRFYAGVPLVSMEGMRVGALCIKDTEPRSLTPQEQKTLVDLASLASHVLELRAAALEYQAASRELAVAHEVADASRRAKATFLANIGHEIRTPLTAIMGFTDIFLDPGSDEGDRRAAAASIRRNSQALLNLINDVLALSRMDGVQEVIEAASCRWLDVIRGVVDAARAEAAGKKLDFTFELEGPVPEEIITNANDIRHALSNILDNAVKFTQRGSVSVAARLRRAEAGELAGGWLELDVIDTGVGISDEQVHRLFRPFTPGDESMTRQHTGVGLGLSVARKLVAAQGGDVSIVETASGVGTRVRLTIPTGPLERVRLISPSGSASMPVGPAGMPARSPEFTAPTPVS
ncbi:MAG: Sensor histidine kinase RcsC [Phycisphaerae bacterium]|nr:Sensor histidine kinase RcsC [Phycisphaerae bacterium]